MIEVNLYLFVPMYVLFTGFAVFKAYRLGRLCGYDNGVVDGTNGKFSPPAE